MKELFIVGNWKSNKTSSETAEWFKVFAPLLAKSSDLLSTTHVIICTPFTDLPELSRLHKEFAIPLELGAQDVSPFPEGAYTGEVSARMISEHASWVIIGHSERRKYLHEQDEELANEAKRAKEAGLKVVYCVPDADTTVPEGVDVVGYEPVWAIGTGKVDTPENANATVTQIKAKTHVPKVLYGGSVTDQNVAGFMKQTDIDGVLVGGASLDPAKFHQLIVHASSEA